MLKRAASDLPEDLEGRLEKIRRPRSVARRIAMGVAMLAWIGLATLVVVCAGLALRMINEVPDARVVVRDLPDGPVKEGSMPVMPTIAVALFVVVWPGHDIPPQSMPATECDHAASAITLAANIRGERYPQDAEVRAYCVPMGTAADPTVYALMAPPPPPPLPPPPVKATLLPMPPPPPALKD